jgi:hypothetical protein
MSEEAKGYFELSNGEVRGWAFEGASAHLKCVTAYGDPVELKELCATLLRLATLVE